jgi:hypothetical protein
MAAITIAIILVFLILIAASDFGDYYIGSFYVFVVFNSFIIISIHLINFYLKSKHKKIILIAIISVIGISVIIYACKNITENNPDNIVIIESDDIINDFTNYGIEASKRYKGKIIEINGIITDKAFPKDWKPLWNASCIYFENEENKKAIIVCNFDEIVVHDLEIGQKITVRYKFKKYMEYEKFNEIEFVKGRIIK